MTEEKRKIREEVITSTNMTHNSRKAWKTINKLSNDPTSSNPPCLVTDNQVAHQLLVNGRGTIPSKPKRPVLPPSTEGDTSKVYPFSEGEYNKGVAALKNNKAAGRDDILVEQLKHIGPKAHKWLLTMLNICFMENKIPTIWRQSKIIAILKPGKDSSIPKNYRPISLLCHTYKLYEWKKRLEEKAHAGLVNLYEDLATGHDSPWLNWRCLNRLRTGYTCSKEQRKKWVYFNGDTTCECGLETENTSHMLQCTLLAHPCTLDDLLEFNDTAQACTERWKKIVG